MNRRKVSHTAASRCLAWVITLLILFAMTVATVIAQTQDGKKTVTGTPITAGEAFTLHSKILGEDRTVYVALPASYSRSGQSYPVLYLTDAQWNFAHTRTTAFSLARNRLIPEVIVVGVTNSDRTRDLYATRADFKRGGQTIPFPTSGNADRFLEFFEKELITWTEANYRTVPLRILAGQSAGGNFALHAMRVKPGLFQAIIAASPWLAWDDRKELNALVTFLSSAKVPLRNLFFSYADEGAEMKGDIDALANALQSRKIPTLRWKSTTYPTETHDSTVMKSYFDGLRMIFDGWDYPRDQQTNLLKGSLSDLKTHYRKLGEQLGVDLLPYEGVVNELGYQYLRANATSDAIATFRFNTEKFPHSANVWDSLGEALEKAGKLDDALVSYQKAVSLAEANRDTRVGDFRKNVSRLSELVELPKPDIADGKYGLYKASTFDLWKAKSTKPTPLMVYIHGGGLAGGDKSRISFSRIKALLDSGISVMSINYRLTGEVIFPQHYMDSARAIQYARYNAKDFNIDPDLIGALGGSAGGMTALWIGFHDDIADPNNADPVLRQSTRLKVIAPDDAQTTLVPDVVAKYVGVLATQYQAYYDGRVFGISKEEAMSLKAIDLYKQISPLTYLTKDDPPVWAVYDIPDKPLTAQSTAEFAIHHPGFGKVLKEEMDKLKIECKLIQAEDGQNVNGDMVAFLGKYLKK